jgi:hypothetical protein
MKALDDAWRWYVVTRKHLRLLNRLAEKHWDSLPWDGPLGRDDAFKTIEGKPLEEDGILALDWLDDLGVLVLFSTFEAVVRERVRNAVEDEAVSLRHVTLKNAVRQALDQVDKGSFFKVLEPYKDLDADLVEKVNQVRNYRNWVAHGRRPGGRPDAVLPKDAYDRLAQFLSLIDPSASPDDAR